MSRFVRLGEQPGTSGVNLYNCAITTTCSVSASNYCGSGKTLCDTRWDLVCCFTNTNNNFTGSIGSNLRIELPTHCYSEFDFSLEGLCTCFGAANLYLSNSVCACTCCTGGWRGCNLNSACGILGFSSSVRNCCQGICVRGCCGCCNNTISFDLMLKKTIPDNGISIYYCTYQCDCFNYMECRASVCGSCPMNLAWNCDCDCICRFTSIVLCASSCMLYSNELNFRLYGRKDNYTCYSTLG